MPLILRRCQLLLRAQPYRHVQVSPMATAAVQPRAQKEEGSISSVFTTLSGEADALPQRFSDLKKEIWKESLVQSWKEVLSELEQTTEEVIARGADMIPRVSFDEVQQGLAEGTRQSIKKVGSVIVTGGVPKEEALAWKQSIRDYVAANKSLVKGFPPENIQAFELYNSKAQIAARTHPSLITTQRALLSLWHTSGPKNEVSLSTPISYFDRLRMRDPGDAKFTLGPHIDGGSVERWEDPGFRTCWKNILAGGSQWRNHDAFDASPRIHAKQDLYHAPNQCSVFRPFQGWTSLSTTGPNEGTLRVLPFLSLSTAYIILRPFFRPRVPSDLSFSNWELDLEGTAFPGSDPGKAQELNDKTHPHLRLDKTMLSMPKVEPGDQVYWHCDVVHAVEAHHGGTSDSSVLYIPTVPLTAQNAIYLRDQRYNFLTGLPGPDFPGGEGESHFTGRAGPDDVTTAEGRQFIGLEPFSKVPSGDEAVIDEANRLIFPS